MHQNYTTIKYYVYGYVIIIRKAPRLQSGASKGIIIINDNSVCIPLFGKEGLGEIIKLFVKSPFIPLWKRGRREWRTIHKNGV